MNTKIEGTHAGTYTPGEWVAYRLPGASPMYPTLGWSVAVKDERTGFHSILAKTTDQDSQANAERIAACVNACDGFTTAQLESPVGILVEPTRERDALRAENVRLRDALRDLLAACDGPALGTTQCPQWRAVCNATAALDKVRP